MVEQLDKEDGKILGSKYKTTWGSRNHDKRTLGLSMPTLIHEAAAPLVFPHDGHLVQQWSYNPDSPIRLFN